MTNVLKSYHLFCIFLLYVGRLSPTSSKTDIIKLCVIVFSSHYHIFQPVKMLNCFADSIMKTYFDRYVQSTPNRKPHISEITGSCCLYTRYILAFNFKQQYTYQSSDLVKIFLHSYILVYILAFRLSQKFFFTFKQQYTY